MPLVTAPTYVLDLARYTLSIAVADAYHLKFLT